MTKSPNLVSTLRWIYDVASVRRLDTVEANAIMPAAHERNIFSVRPAKRHCRAGWTTASHTATRLATASPSRGGQVRSVPQLFGDHAALIRKVFHRCDEALWVAASSQFVMAAFSR